MVATDEAKAKLAALKEDLLRKKAERDSQKSASVAQERPLAKLVEAEQKLGKERMIEEKNNTVTPAPTPATLPTLSLSAMSLFGSKFWLLLVVAIGNFILSWSLSGFNLDATAIVLDIVTFVIFWFSFGIGISLLLLLAETFVPFILLSYGVFPVVSYILTHAPIWAIFIAIDKVVSDPESKPAKVIAAIAVVALLIFAAPSLLSASTRNQYTSFNTEEINNFKDSVSESISNSFTAASNLIKIQYCKLFDPDKSNCVLPEEKADKEFLASEIRTTDAGILVTVSDNFLSDGKLAEDQVGVDTPFTNKLTSPAKIIFSCGLDRREPGVTQPSEVIIQPGASEQISVVCSGLNVSKAGSMNFYFNATAVDLISSGERTFLVMDAGVRKTILDASKGSNEKDKWNNAPVLYSGQMRPYLPLLNSLVGSTDAIQPVLKLGGVGSIRSPSPIVYGVSPELQIPFGLYIINNGKGKIISIKDIQFSLNPLFEFDVPNCGITADWLRTTPWRTYIGDSYAKRFCQLKATAQREYPNDISPLTIGVKVTYDYSVSKSKEIIIPQRAA